MRHQMNQYNYLEEEWDGKIRFKSNCCNELLNKDSTSSEFMKWDNKSRSSLFWKFFICFGEYLSFLLFFLVGVESDSPEHIIFLYQNAMQMKRESHRELCKNTIYFNELIICLIL